MTAATGAQLLLGLVVGALAGGLYFGGLWFTVRRLATARRPLWVLIGSFAARLALLLVALYLLAGRHWSSLVGALLGVLLARTVLIRRWGPPPAPRARRKPDG